MRTTIALFLMMLALVATQGCSDSASDEEALRDAVVTALDASATELSAD